MTTAILNYTSTIEDGGKHYLVDTPTFAQKIGMISRADKVLEEIEAFLSSHNMPTNEDWQRAVCFKGGEGLADARLWTDSVRFPRFLPATPRRRPRRHAPRQ